MFGCGHLGRTLGRLFLQHEVLELGAVATRSLTTARDAVAFMGGGYAATLDRDTGLATTSDANLTGMASPDTPTLPDTSAADITLIATPDDAIATSCEALARSSASLRGKVVFHCSGALSSDALAAAREAGAHTASVHPVMSFADPESAAGRFAGTFCGCEGDEAALAVLRPLFEAIGGQLFAVDSASKTLYHAGSVIACNYLVALLEAALSCFEHAGVERDLAGQILAPLIGGTVENVISRGSVSALTGPIARGEPGLIAHQLAALEAVDPDLCDLYRALGRATLELARTQGSASAEALDEIARLLARRS